MTPRQLREKAKEARALAKVCLDAGNEENAAKCIMAALRYDALLPEPIAGLDWPGSFPRSTGPFIDDEEFEKWTLRQRRDVGPLKCRDCVKTEKEYPGYGYRCRKFPKCGYPIHPGGCQCGCKTP